MKKAFTLAEVLITLTVIGIITAVIIPVAMHSKPDENVMKFKKAHNTLYQTISTLVNSDKYYLDGDLGIRAGGSRIEGKTDKDRKYFCETFADVITTKSVNCSTYTVNVAETGYYFLDTRNGYKGNGYSIDKAKQYADNACKNASTIAKVGEEIKTTDNVVFYETVPGISFGVDFDPTRNPGLRLFGPINKSIHTTEAGTDAIYKTFCIDIDGINKGENPFGYGIRADGKILTGKRADEWLNKSLQGEN